MLGQESDEAKISSHLNLKSKPQNGIEALPKVKEHLTSALLLWARSILDILYNLFQMKWCYSPGNATVQSCFYLFLYIFLFSFYFYYFYRYDIIWIYDIFFMIIIICLSTKILVSFWCRRYLNLILLFDDKRLLIKLTRTHLTLKDWHIVLIIMHIGRLIMYKSMLCFNKILQFVSCNLVYIIKNRKTHYIVLILQGTWIQILYT